jgi:hypothetical protein
MSGKHHAKREIHPFKEANKKKIVLQTTLIKKCGDIKHSGENGKFNQTKNCLKACSRIEGALLRT